MKTNPFYNDLCKIYIDNFKTKENNFDASRLVMIVLINFNCIGCGIVYDFEHHRL